MKWPRVLFIKQRARSFNFRESYEKQALILVNYGHAQGRDILELAQNIQRSVLEKFFITLEMEVNLIQ